MFYIMETNHFTGKKNIVIQRLNLSLMYNRVFN